MKKYVSIVFVMFVLSESSSTAVAEPRTVGPEDHGYVETSLGLGVSRQPGVETNGNFYTVEMGGGYIAAPTSDDRYSLGLYLGRGSAQFLKNKSGVAEDDIETITFTTLSTLRIAYQRSFEKNTGFLAQLGAGKVHGRYHSDRFLKEEIHQAEGETFTIDVGLRVRINDDFDVLPSLSLWSLSMRLKKTAGQSVYLNAAAAKVAFQYNFG